MVRGGMRQRRSVGLRQNNQTRALRFGLTLVRSSSSLDAPAQPPTMHFSITEFMAANDKPIGITSVSTEKRVFQPPKAFSKAAHIKSLAQYRKLYNESVKSPE